MTDKLENSFFQYFSKLDNFRKYVLIFLGIGFILRFLVASKVRLLGDEMIHGVHSLGIISSGVINLQNQSPAWYYLTDLSYIIFGVHAFSGRFLSIFFGSLSIVLIFLIANYLFNKRIALISAFLLTISSFTLRYTLMEMDLALIFFILFAFYFFVKDIEEKKKISIFVPILLGIAILIKPIALPFLLSFPLYFFFNMKKEERRVFIKTSKEKIISSLSIIFLFCMPVLAFNYILYKQKGITDVIFSRFLKISQEIYSPLQGYDKGFSITDIFMHGIPTMFKASFIPLDPAIFLIGLLGIFLIFKKPEYKKGKFLVIFHIIPAIFLLGTSWLQTHLVPFMILFSICAGVSIDFIANKLGKEKNYKKIAIAFVVIIAIINGIIIAPYLGSPSGIFETRKYIHENTEENALIIADSRIYRGRIAWMFNDKYYLESSYLDQLLSLNKNLTSPKNNVNLYFIECAIDDCGWGTIKDQPEFNQSVEQMVSFFSSNAQKIKTINGGGGDNEEVIGKPYINVYKASLMISPEIYSAVKETHDWFYYPVRWEKSDWYDSYYPSGIIQETLHAIGKIMLWFAIIGALLSPILLMREFFIKS